MMNPEWRQAIVDALDSAEQREAEAIAVYLDSCPAVFITCAQDCLDCQTEAAAFYEFEAARAATEELRAYYSRAGERARENMIEAGRKLLSWHRTME